MGEEQSVSQILEYTSISLDVVQDALDTFEEKIEDEISNILGLSNNDQYVKYIWERYQILRSILTLAMFRIGGITQELDEHAGRFRDMECEELCEVNQNQT